MLVVTAVPAFCHPASLERLWSLGTLSIDEEEEEDDE